MCVKSSKNFNFACNPLSVFTFFNYPSLPHFKSQWAQILTHIFQIFRWVNAHLLIYGLYKLGLFWILKIIPNSSPRKILIQIIPNGEIRNNLSFNLFGFTCFDFLCKILKSENETQASDCMIIGYCEPLVFNIHGYLLWVYV
jgi:hypothetical protein